MSFLQPYLAAIKIGAALVLLVALGAALLAYNEHERDIGRAEIQQAWDQATAVAFKARAARIEQVREAELALQAATNEDRRKLSALQDLHDARVAALTRELRNRPERPAAGKPPDVPAGAAGPGPAAGCTGAGLYRDDGVFLAGFARMCQAIRDQRDDYLRQYQRAQQKLRALGATP